ncbi:MAG TPA: protein translocase subunit SecDF [Erysipelotrichaceae bacterium]|nr:protein translocase subunit SecDF [Erysipelotrichaceae bacterium]
MTNRNKKGNLYVFFAAVVVIAALIAGTFTKIRDGLNLGLDLRGGFEILYQVTPLKEDSESAIDMTAVINSISKRINVLGVSEPTILVEGDDRLRIQLAGVEDQESARAMIGTTANLTFRDVDDKELANSEILVEGGASLAYDPNTSQPIVSLKIADKTAFGELTKNIAAKSSTGDNILIIWLDWEEGDTYKAELAKQQAGEEPKYISAASVRQQITDDCIISGSFTEQEARTLANLINSGSLPVKLTELSSNVVSAQFGADALQKTATAGLIGILLVIAFMVIRYRLPGVVTAVMLSLYIWAVFGIYSLMGAVFTLSGIGALVLGIGMTVDANIISYERIRQELYKGRNIRNSVAEGQTQSFSAVFDAQFTTLIAALIMYIWGNGAVKGFATMLIITVVMTLVLNVGFSRWLLKLLVESGIADGKPEWFGVKKTQIPDIAKGQSQFYTGTHHYDYASKSRYAFIASIAIVALSLVLGFVNLGRGTGFFNLGIDFASGTKLTISSDQEVKIEDVEAKIAELGYSGFKYQASGENTVYATTKQALETEDLTKIKSALKEVYGEEPGDNVVTPVVGRDLVRNAVILTIVAWIAMMAYVTFRYEWDYALGCIVALIHDVLIVLAVFGILRLEVNTELISVLLTIIGYSINNSIVVFDRVRETMQGKKGKLSGAEYDAITNDSMDATIKMSICSTITTMLPVIMLLIMGSRSIFTFIFAMFVGLIAGTISSIFIAPAIWRWARVNLRKNDTQKTKKKAKKEVLDEYTFKGINA